MFHYLWAKCLKILGDLARSRIVKILKNIYIITLRVKNILTYYNMYLLRSYMCYMCYICRTASIGFSILRVCKLLCVVSIRCWWARLLDNWSNIHLWVNTHSSKYLHVNLFCFVRLSTHSFKWVPLWPGLLWFVYVTTIGNNIFIFSLVKNNSTEFIWDFNVNFFVFHFYPNLHLARKPEKVDHIDVAGCIGDVIKAYTALYYQARVCGGETILIFNGASVST